MHMTPVHAHDSSGGTHVAGPLAKVCRCCSLVLLLTLILQASVARATLVCSFRCIQVVLLQSGAGLSSTNRISIAAFCCGSALQGFVYIKFGTADAAAAAHKMLHSRFYNGHQIQAAYQFVQTYNQHFGL